jgi:preprotein translocase subunit SecA
VAVFDRVLRAGETRILRKLESVADQVEDLAEDFAAMSDEELRGQTEEFKKRYAEGETLDDLAAEAFARQLPARWVSVRSTSS